MENDRKALSGAAQLEARIELALAHAKRVQRESRMTVQQLAQIRDEITEQKE